MTNCDLKLAYVHDSPIEDTLEDSLFHFCHQESSTCKALFHFPVTKNKKKALVVSGDKSDAHADISVQTGLYDPEDWTGDPCVRIFNRRKKAILSIQVELNIPPFQQFTFLRAYAEKTTHPFTAADHQLNL